MKLLVMFFGLVLACLVFPVHARSGQVASIAVVHPYARATAPGQPNGGAYLTLDNRGGANDRLVSASTEVCQSAQLHAMKMDGDVMRMRHVDAIDVPAGQTLVLRPGGLHIMLVGLKSPLKIGDSFPMTLRFEKAGEVTVRVAVRAADAGPSGHDTKH